MEQSIETASREILWNVGSLSSVVIMYSLMVLSMIVAGIGIWRRVELWSSGRPSPEHTGNWPSRVWDFFTTVLLQRKVVRDPKPGLMHTMIYLGFLVLLFTTTMVFIDHDLGIEIYHGRFYLAVTLFSDLFGIAFLAGCLLAGNRRYIERSDRLNSWTADSFMLSGLMLLIVQGFLLEGLRIHATQDPWAIYSPVGYLVAKLFWPLSAASASKIHFFTWWFHTITVFVMMALLPYTKLFHILSSSSNLFFHKTNRPKGALQYPGDLEKLVEQGEEFTIGLGTIKDYSWKQILDLDACTSCGRCQEACPAYNSGKPLSPKWLILDTRNHALALNSKTDHVHSKLPPAFTTLDKSLTSTFLASAGMQDESKYISPEFRAQNPEVQKSSRMLGQSWDQKISGDVLDPNVFWSCTTCMACVEACPVGINHVDQIIGNRRNMVLMEGQIPAEAQPTLRALENRSNPFGAPEDRIKWLEGLNVRILKEGEEVDYLYWVGCVSAFDPRKQKIARSLVRLMENAGLSFGILGNSEGCSGDPARRLGEENLYQTLAKTNIELLCSVKFKVLVANCPHCFNTIRNEYPQFGNLGNGQSPEIIHHSVLLKRLLKENKLNLVEGSSKDITFHDPCYLGRYNDEYEAPRDTLKSNSKLNIIEMDQSREKGLCCGAGGGHFWMDMKIGKRVNVMRADQAAATGASEIATACPFCMQMLEDGVKLTNREESMKVRDIAEILAERLILNS